jgi:hypothetical protein
MSGEEKKIHTYKQNTKAIIIITTTAIIAHYRN